MDLERALAIVKAINNRCLFGMGMVAEENIGSLEGVSLAEMIEAKAVVEAQNTDGEARQKVEGGSRTIHVVPDDRLIAAAYCMEHYPLDKEAIVVMPMARDEVFWSESKTGRKALAIVPLIPAKEDEADHG